MNHRKLILFSGIPIVIIIAIIVIITIVHHSNTTKAQTSPNSTTSKVTSDKSGFPSYQQLTSLTNYTSTTTVATLVTVEQVHSPTNLLQKSGSAAKQNIESLLIGNTIYSAVQGIAGSTSQAAADSSDSTPELYQYAKQVSDFVTKGNTGAVQTTKLGSCKIAGHAGNQWLSKIVGPTAQYIKSEFLSCTDASTGALLELQEGMDLVATGNQKVTAAITVDSIGNVPAFTVADL